MTKLNWIASVLVWLITTVSIHAYAEEGSIPINETAKSFIADVVVSNEAFQQEVDPESFKPYMNKQVPRATVVMCSDSRVPTRAIMSISENDLFVIRNIGNQVVTSMGSLEFGIKYLKTPVVMIIGHSRCGAVAASMGGNLSELTDAVKGEIKTLSTNPKENLADNLVGNVHNQVDAVLKSYGHLVKQGKLVVLAGIYDFADDFHTGPGSLVFVNLNGERDPKKLEQDPYFRVTPAFRK
jgi:carbonic anhydrase